MEQVRSKAIRRWLKQSSLVPSAQSVNNIAENVLWGDDGGLSRAGAGH
jgi:hypothetical protein